MEMHLQIIIEDLTVGYYILIQEFGFQIFSFIIYLHFFLLKV